MPLLAAPTLNAATLPPQMREALEPFRRTLERFGRDASAAVGASIQYDDNLELYSASITTPDDWHTVGATGEPAFQNSVGRTSAPRRATHRRRSGRTRAAWFR
jgi:hypothetical protein